MNYFLLGKYVDHQKKKQAEKIRQNKTDADKLVLGDKIKLTKWERETLRCDKNHLFMKQKHQDTTYKVKEKQKNLESKRADLNRKEMGREYIRKKRKDSEVKKEAEFKRQKRRAPGVKEKEAVLKDKREKIPK